MWGGDFLFRLNDSWLLKNFALLSAQHFFQKAKKTAKDFRISGPPQYKAKVKFTLEHAMKVEKWGLGIALLFL